MSHRPPPPTKQPTEESGNWPALVINGREPTEMAAEGHQTKGQPARGREKPGRAREGGRRRAPEAGATGSRQGKAGASPRSRPQKAPGAEATGSRREKAWASPRRWPQRAPGGRNDGLASEQLSGKRTKTRRRGGRAKAKMHGQAGHDAGRRRQTQADAGRRQAGGARVPYFGVRVQ